MKLFVSKCNAAICCIVSVCVAMLVSCGGSGDEITSEYVADLQKQLDTTMSLYEQLKTENAEFDKKMASRDSAIQAQAAEIQSLIDRCNGKPQKNVAPSSDAQSVDAQKKELKNKENEIKKLQKQIDQQSKQIKELKAANESKAGSSSNDKQYKSQIAALTKQVNDQDKQIKQLKNSLNAKEKSSTDCDNVKKGYDKQVADLKGQVNDYKGEVSTLKKQIDELKAELRTAKSNASTNDDKNAEALKTAQSQLATLTAQLNECNRLNAQYQNDVKAAQSQLEKCQSESSSNSSQQDKTAALIAQCEKDKQDLQNTITALQTQISALDQQIDRLRNENATLTQYVQNSGNSNSSAETIALLNAQIEEQRAQIASLQEQLRQKEEALAKSQTSGKSTKPTKGEMDKSMAELQALCDSYAAEIERLKAENAQLKSENADLKEKVASSASLFAENAKLQQKVKLASVLVTTDVTATPGKSVKTGNIVKPTDKASQTQVVRVDCRLLDNNVIDPGSITIYARIANAANRVVTNGDASTSSFDLNGVQMLYTMKQDIEFTGYGRKLTMLWKRMGDTELVPGLYWVTLYANGYEIGKTSFTLK